MSDASIKILDGDGATEYLHTDEKSYGGTNKNDQYTLLADSRRVTYTAVMEAVSCATSAAHVAILQADGTNYTKLWGIDIQQVGLPTAALANFQILRTTTAGSGGTSISAYPMDGADTSPYGGVIQTLPSSKGTEGVMLLKRRISMVAALPVSSDQSWSWRADTNQKPITVGTANTGGVCLKIVTGIASLTVDVILHFYTTATL